MNYICPTCKKTRDQLVEENKLHLVQGYDQCGDCWADLEHESVVMREELLKEGERKAIENNDYTIIPPNLELAADLGIEPKEAKIPNTYKYLPEWYRKEQEEGYEATNELFRSLNKGYKDYAEIID